MLRSTNAFSNLRIRPRLTDGPNMKISLGFAPVSINRVISAHMIILNFPKETALLKQAKNLEAIRLSNKNKKFIYLDEID